MANSVVPPGLDTPAAWIGYLVAGITALGVWVRDKRKGDVDQTAVILTGWKDLMQRHETTLESLNAEVKSLRDRLLRAEERISTLEEENRMLRRENEGYVRQLAQRSQSQVEVLGAAMLGANAPTAKARFGVGDQDADLIGKLDRKGGE